MRAADIPPGRGINGWQTKGQQSGAHTEFRSNQKELWPNTSYIN